MTIAHTGIFVPKAIHADVVAWYLKALEPLGYKKIVDIGVAVGLGDKEFEPDWWIIGGDPPAGATSHTAFASPGKPTLPARLSDRGFERYITNPGKDRAKVEAFHKAAIDAGGKDNGPPGVRTQYHANYYAAFVKDPAGNNIEVLCQAPQQE